MRGVSTVDRNKPKTRANCMQLCARVRSSCIETESSEFDFAAIESSGITSTQCVNCVRAILRQYRSHGLVCANELSIGITAACSCLMDEMSRVARGCRQIGNCWNLEIRKNGYCGLEGTDNHGSIIEKLADPTLPRILSASRLISFLLQEMSSHQSRNEWTALRF